eukprot:CAMPEP_0116118726 /NCGR_PEP_ID=MMETSP0329-20121206/2260_1 /TAXON_ID=697910 /ORGANISM="Pseudo-nitzschia arenysensis, Strain B593" /LENGTH=486 /DNA_ID=CAMNT_0003612377 /DNA_START=395 /DNA_END=1855 /DNA_ORIENTATION=+
MESTRPAEAAEVSVPGVGQESQGAGTKSAETLKKAPPKLALIPMWSATIKIARQQQKPLEAKQFPIVLGRTNLSQWWYESCDCQQYYCRLHCRPVAKNIGSLSKVMIQIDTQGKAHIVGKNPHLVTITSPERNNNNNNNNNNNANNNETTKGDKDKSEKSVLIEAKEDHQNPIVLKKGDILSIGRRDREPWMRFQVVENPTGAASLATGKKKESPAKILRPSSNERLVKSAASSLELPIPAAQESAKPPAQQRHDARLPEWITTTTTTNNEKALPNYFGEPTNTATDTKEQQHHQAMVATLTRAAAAAGAAADANERNKSKKPYRYNSYYNYYNHNNSGSNYEVDPTQRKRRRTSSFPTASNVSNNSNNYNSKSLIRSAEDLFNGSRKGGRYHHNNDPQIHLVFQDYETSAQLIRAGTKQARNHPGHAGRKRARTDRNFIGKPDEAMQQQQPKSMGLMLSKNYAAALLEVETPSLAQAKSTSDGNR